MIASTKVVIPLSWWPCAQGSTFAIYSLRRVVQESWGGISQGSHEFALVATRPRMNVSWHQGINLGDVIVEGERLYGDGVNIAARLESLAIPGGICISGTVYDHVENKLALNYNYQGEQTVKNIAKPVRMYRVVMDEAAATLAEQLVLRQVQHERESTPVILSLSKDAQLKRRGGLLLAGLVLIAATFVTVTYFSFPTNTQPLAPRPRQRRCHCPTSPPSSSCPSTT